MHTWAETTWDQGRTTRGDQRKQYATLTGLDQSSCPPARLETLSIHKAVGLGSEDPELTATLVPPHKSLKDPKGSNYFKKIKCVAEKGSKTVTGIHKYIAPSKGELMSGTKSDITGPIKQQKVTGQARPRMRGKSHQLKPTQNWHTP